MREVTAFLWFGNCHLTQFMWAADLFGQYKVLGNIAPHEITLTYKKGVVLKTSLRKSREALRPAMLLAMYVPNIPGCNWRDQSVWEISNGTSSCLLSDLLKHFGYPDAPNPFKIGSPEYLAGLAARNWDPKLDLTLTGPTSGL
jgi:hypothetical protein